jgi:hypothetical protein
VESVRGPLLAGPLVGFVRQIGVIPVGPLANLKACFIGEALEACPALSNPLRTPGDDLPLGGNARMELERVPLNLDVVFFA